MDEVFSLEYNNKRGITLGFNRNLRWLQSYFQGDKSRETEFFLLNNQQLVYPLL